MSTADFKDLIDRLGVASTECRDLLKDVHAATKDLKRAKREADEAREVLETAVKKALEEGIRQEVVSQLAEFQGEVAQGRDEIIDKMNDAFEELFNLYIYGNKEGTGANIVDLMRQASLGNLYAAGQGLPIGSAGAEAILSRKGNRNGPESAEKGREGEAPPKDSASTP
jgi:hypothetical protein